MQRFMSILLAIIVLVAVLLQPGAVISGPFISQWTKVASQGFGDSANTTVLSMAQLNGVLYAGTYHTTHGGEVWRTGGGAWTNVTPPTHPFADVMDMHVYNNHLYIAAGNLWRTDGLFDPTTGKLNWTQMTAAPGSVESIMDFKGSLYVGVGDESGGGAEIWRSADGVGNWQKVATNGFGDPNNNFHVQSMATLGGKLYAGTTGGGPGIRVGKAQVWVSGNGTSWTQNNADHFGETDYKRSWGVQALYAWGGYLYAGTISDGPARVYRTSGNGAWSTAKDWPPICVPPSEDCPPIRIPALASTLALSPWDSSGLYFGDRQTSDVGGRVFATSDGVNWTMDNSSGFGTSNNPIVYALSPLVIPPKKFWPQQWLYAGTYNPTAGAEVWRKEIPSRIEVPNLILCAPGCFLLRHLPWEPRDPVWTGLGLRVDPAGITHALWAHPEGEDWNVLYAQLEPGSEWSSPLIINDDAGLSAGSAAVNQLPQQIAPSAYMDDAGTLHAVWLDDRNSEIFIYYAQKSEEGAWGPNERVGDVPLEDWGSRPGLAVDREGTVHVVWDDGGPAFNRTIYYAWRAPGPDGLWSSPEGVYEGDSQFPTVAVDSLGTAHVVWLFCDGGACPEGSIPFYAYRARDTEGLWGEIERVTDADNTLGFTDFGTPALDVDSNDTLHAAWVDSRNGDADIYYAQRPPGGVWTLNERVNDDVGDAPQTAPTLAVENDGTARAAWVDSRSDNPDIYAADRPADGAWGENFRVNDDTGTAEQHLPTMDLDADGNSYLAWIDESAYATAFSRQTLAAAGTADLRFGRRFARPGGCWGDATQDGERTVDDLMLMADAWRQTASDAGYRPRFDLDGDAVINILDLAGASVVWGVPCD